MLFIAVENQANEKIPDCLHMATNANADRPRNLTVLYHSEIVYAVNPSISDKVPTPSTRPK